MDTIIGMREATRARFKYFHEGNLLAFHRLLEMEERSSEARTSDLCGGYLNLILLTVQSSSGVLLIGPWEPRSRLMEGWLLDPWGMWDFFGLMPGSN